MGLNRDPHSASLRSAWLGLMRQRCCPEHFILQPSLLLLLDMRWARHVSSAIVGIALCHWGSSLPLVWRLSWY